MLFNNRQFPHPVLGIGDDVNGHLEVELNISSNKELIEISPYFNLIYDDLLSYIKKHEALFISHVYCRGTMYREVFKTERHIPESIKIPSTKLNGEVEIDFFICANKSLTNYKSTAFNSDYLGYSFSLDKGDILAYAGKGSFYANKSPEELKSISALMNIANSGKKNEAMFNDYNGDKITIMLCEEDYSNYQVIKRSPIYINVILSSIVLPALIESIYFLNADEALEFKEKRWFKFLKETLNRSKENSPLIIAQNILDQPNARAFGTIINLLEETTN